MHTLRRQNPAWERRPRRGCVPRRECTLDCPLSSGRFLDAHWMPRTLFTGEPKQTSWGSGEERPHTIQPDSLSSVILLHPSSLSPWDSLNCGKLPGGILVLRSRQPPPALFRPGELCVTLNCSAGRLCQKPLPTHSPLLPSTLQAGEPETGFPSLSCSQRGQVLVTEM